MSTHSLRLSFRRLVRQRAFSVPAIATLALGLATVLAVYGPLESIALRPLPYSEPDRLVRVWLAVPELGEGQLWGLSKASLPHFEASSSVDALALYSFGSAVLGNFGGEGKEQVSTAEVSAGLFELLDAPVALGRPMTGSESFASERSSGLLSPAWISDRLWRIRFGAADDTVGRVIELSGEPVEIVGILAPNSRFPEEIADGTFRVDVWKPLALGPASDRFGSHVYRGIARLAPSFEMSHAEGEIATIIAGLPEAEPSVYSPKLLGATGLRPELVSLRHDVVGSIRQLLWILFAVVLLVLAMALTNVGNLVAVYADRSRRESGVRAALGASPVRAISALLLDVTLVTLLASVLAFLLARWVLDSSLALIGPELLPRFDEIHLSPWALVACLAISLVLTLSVALLAVSGGRPTASTFRSTGAVRSSRGLAAMRRASVTAQIALSVALLAGAFLLLRTSTNLERVDLGFARAGSTHVRVMLSAETFPDLGSLASGYRRLADAAGDVAGVNSVSIAAHLPLHGMDGCSAIYDAGGPAPSAESARCLPVFLISPGYFETLGISVQGRVPTWADLTGRTPVAVASQAFARRMWPELEPSRVIGQEVLTGPTSPAYQIIGVAADIHASGGGQPVSEILYLPIVPASGDETWGPIRSFSLSATTPATLVEATVGKIRDAARDLDPRSTTLGSHTMSELVNISTAQTRLLMRLVSLASFSALVLGAFGIYSVLAYLTSSRRAELGVRMALGATHREIYSLVVGEALRLAFWGIGLGLVVVLVLGPHIEKWLFRVSPHDPLILSLVCLAAVFSVVAAAIVPAYRAASLPVMVLLRRD